MSDFISDIIHILASLTFWEWLVAGLVTQIFVFVVGSIAHGIYGEIEYRRYERAVNKQGVRR